MSPTKQGNWSNLGAVKIQERNPEVLAKKIIEQGRNLEKSKSSETSAILSPRSRVNSSYIPAPSSGVEVRKVESIEAHNSKLDRSPSNLQRSSPLNNSSSRHSLQNPSSLPHSDIHTTNNERSAHHQSISSHSRNRIVGCNSNNQSPTSAIVDLPKVDLKLSLSNTSCDAMANSIAAAMSSASGHLPSLSQTQKDPPLVLPPHPDSRSRSSEGQTGEDMSFASTKGNNHSCAPYSTIMPHSPLILCPCLSN